MSLAFATEWAASYKRSWETLDTELFVSLFTSTALYYPTPFSQAYRAKDLGRLWNTLKTLQRDNHIEFELWHSSDDIATFRWEGESTRLPEMERRRGSGIFHLKFAEGRCQELLQWQHWHVLRSQPAPHIQLID